MMMTNRLIWLGLILNTLIQAQPITTDSDFDGVPDKHDKCPNTPFLNEVDASGCTVSVLTLPNETDKQDMTIALGYGYTTNKDLKNRERQDNVNLQLNYYNNNWNYALHTGYYKHQLHDGMLDTTLSVKKRIPFKKKWVLGLLAGVRLPTHDYKGNKVDYLFSITLHYYPTANLSLFTGYQYSYIGDEDERIETEESDENKYNTGEQEEKEIKIEKIQNLHRFHLGIGYFITHNFYANLVYSEQKSKFESEHKSAILSSTLYYKIDEKWFTTLYYKREVIDEDLHDSFLFKVGYHIW